MPQCSHCGCDLPGLEQVCRNCFDARHADLRQPKVLPERPRPITAFLFVFSLSFLVGLLQFKFLGYHTPPSVCALFSLAGASLAAYLEKSRPRLTRRRRS